MLCRLPVITVATIRHQPPRGLCEQSTLRINLSEGFDRQGRRFEVVLLAEVEHRAANRFPMGVEVGHARLAFELGDDLAGAVVVSAALQREREQRASISLQFGSLRKQVVDVARFGCVRGVAAHVERVYQISARFGINRLAVFELACVEQMFDALASAIERVAVDGVAGASRHRQPVYDVGRHKRIGLVVLPPAPAAVAVLEAVKAIEPPLNLRGSDRSTP